jgi:GAF domain-containing protein
MAGDWQEEAPGDRAVPGVDIPLKIRDKRVGVLRFQKDADQSGNQDEAPDGRAPSVAWTAEETRFLERLVEQMGLALDGARLYQDTQRRATRERLLGEATTRMRETLDMERVLQTAVEEIAGALGLAALDLRIVREPGAGGDGDGSRPDWQKNL